ncbi:MAG: suppressor of glycerol defect, partial [Pleopsidium flavum]
GSYGARSAKGKRNGPGARKERRKAGRVQKKVQQRPKRPIFNRQSNIDQSDSEEEGSLQRQPSPPREEKTKTGSGDSKPLKSILKRTKQSEEPPQDEGIGGSLISQPSMSKGLRDKLAADDAEIAALEKALGIRDKKRLPKSFEDDGLDELLDGLDESTSDPRSRSGKRKRSEEEEWLERKRRKAYRIQGEGHRGDGGTEEEIDSKSDELMEDEKADEEGHDELEDDKTESIEDDFSGFGSDTSPQPPPPKRVRENPYIAPPVASDTTVHAKYIPPSLRGPVTSDTEASSQLRRRTQGLLNRLSETNLISILGDVERLYRDNPRQHVTSTLVDLLLGLICDKTSLQDTFVILHAGFIVAIHKVIGTDFGAQVIQRVVEEFARFYASMAESEGSRKETTNLVSLLAELYNFQMIGSMLIFDYIRMFLLELSEKNTELLLKIIRISGPQLRHDDPSSLKDVVLLLQTAIAKIGEANLSIRTKFMIETINNLKNNRMKSGAAASAVTSEHTIRMKKTLGSLNTRSLKSSEPLRVG